MTSPIGKPPPLVGGDTTTATFEQVLFTVTGHGSDLHALLDAGQGAGKGWFTVGTGPKPGDKQDDGQSGGTGYSYHAWDKWYIAVNRDATQEGNWKTAIGKINTDAKALATGTYGLVDVNKLWYAKGAVDQWVKWLATNHDTLQQWVKKLTSDDSAFKGKAAHAIQQTLNRAATTIDKLHDQVTIERKTSESLQRTAEALTTFAKGMAKAWWEYNNSLNVILSNTMNAVVNNVHRYIVGMGLAHGSPNYVLDFLASDSREKAEEHIRNTIAKYSSNTEWGPKVTSSTSWTWNPGNSTGAGSWSTNTSTTKDDTGYWFEPGPLPKDFPELTGPLDQPATWDTINARISNYVRTAMEPLDTTARTLIADLQSAYEKTKTPLAKLETPITAPPGGGGIQPPPGGGGNLPPPPGGGGNLPPPPGGGGNLPPPPGGGGNQPPPGGGGNQPPPGGGGNLPPPPGGSGNLPPPPGGGGNQPPPGGGGNQPPPGGVGNVPPPGGNGNIPPPGGDFSTQPPGGNGPPPGGNGNVPPPGGDGNVPPPPPGVVTGNQPPAGGNGNVPGNNFPVIPPGGLPGPFSNGPGQNQRIDSNGNPVDANGNPIIGNNPFDPPGGGPGDFGTNNFPGGNSNLPGDFSNLPPGDFGTNDFPGGNVNLPGDFPGGNSNLPGDFPGGNGNLPGDFPGGNGNLPGDFPGGNSNLPGDFPGGNGNLPGGNSNLPGDFSNLPGGNSNLPGGNSNLPGDFSNLPGGNSNLPGGSSNLPGGSSNLPGGGGDFSNLPGGGAGGGGAPGGGSTGYGGEGWSDWSGQNPNSTNENSPFQGGGEQRQGGMPMMPPMMPPMNGGQGDSKERERQTWLSEDDKVWGTESGASNGVIGLPNDVTFVDEEQLAPTHVHVASTAPRSRPAEETKPQKESEQTATS